MAAVEEVGEDGLEVAPGVYPPVQPLPVPAAGPLAEAEVEVVAGLLEMPELERKTESRGAVFQSQRLVSSQVFQDLFAILIHPSSQRDCEQCLSQSASRARDSHCARKLFASRYCDSYDNFLLFFGRDNRAAKAACAIIFIKTR